MRNFEIASSQEFERTWYDKLDTINLSTLISIIDYNSALNQSADYKYRRIRYFLILMMNRHNRVDDAVKLIDKYWKKLDKKDLLDSLFIYGDFEVFKKYWKKNRTDLGHKFLPMLFRTDEIDRTKWLLADKKFNSLISIDVVEFVANAPKSRWSYLNEEAYKLLSENETIGKIAIDNKLEALYPNSVKDIFLF